MTVIGTLFAAAFFSAMLLALVRNPIFGLYAYVAVFYLHPPSRWWGEFLPDLRWSFTAATITLIAIWIRLPAPTKAEKSWISTWPAKLMIAFSAWFWLESLWALDEVQHHIEAILLTKYVLVYYMIFRLINTPQKITSFLLVHVAGCLYLGYLGYTADSSGRLNGVGGPGIEDSSTLGMQLATAVVIAGMLAIRLRMWRQAVCAASITFSLNAIVLTQGRGAFLGMIAGGFMVFCLRPIVHRRLFIAYAALGLVLFGYVANHDFWARMDTVTSAAGNENEMEFSAMERVGMFEAQIEMAKLYPFGTGHRGSAFLSHTMLDPKFLSSSGGRSSHNVFMTVLVEQGIPGIIMFFGMIGWTAMTLFRLKKAFSGPLYAESAVLNAAIGGALTVVIVAGMFADFAHCEVQIWMFALLARLSALADVREERREKGTAYDNVPDGRAAATKIF